MSTMFLRAFIVGVTLAPLIGEAEPPEGVHNGPDQSPYKGQESRGIKSLSAAELEALQNGHGMGLAKAAELNGFPAPRHVHLEAHLRQKEILNERQVGRYAGLRGYHEGHGEHR